MNAFHLPVRIKDVSECMDLNTLCIFIYIFSQAPRVLMLKIKVHLSQTWAFHTVHMMGRLSLRKTVCGKDPEI